jgi:GT2 family glycosyltransferase
LTAADEFGEFPYDVAADGRGFRIACPRPRGAWSLAFSVDGAKPVLLQGSPLAFPIETPRSASLAARPPVSIVMPVYRDQALVQACINSVLASLPSNATRAELIVIDDASPEPALSAWLDQLAGQGRITLLRNRYNLGFIETTNRGLRLRPQHDALLLNADTLVHGDWIDRLARALYSADDIASVSPWSNNGEITSFPEINQSTDAPSLEQLAQIDRIAADLHDAGLSQDIDMPACCGFAMLMRRSVIDRIGVLDGINLVRGYGEEVDWCMRARAAGFRHLAATGVFIAHSGTVSFRHEKTLRVRQNKNVLVATYADYWKEYLDFARTDPLAGARQELALALAARDAGWPDGADTEEDRQPDSPTAGQPLPSSSQRIAVWHHRVGSPAAGKILELARLIAALDHASFTAPVRMLIIGEAGESLWHTGVVDVLPWSTWPEARLLNNAELLRMVPVNAVLHEDDAPGDCLVPSHLIDNDFDPAAWLRDYLAPLARTEQALPTSLTYES